MNIKKKPLFLRKDSTKKIRIGRRKKSRWRKQKGGDSKIRQRMKGYRKTPSIGYGSDKKTRYLIQLNEKVHGPIIIQNVDDLNKLKENESVIIAHIGKKNKIKIL